MTQNQMNCGLTAKDIVLLILRECGNSSQLRGITRIEKLGFLLTLQPEFRELRNTLSYSALHYGPYSRNIAESVEILSAYDYLIGKPVHFEVQLENRADEELIENSRDVIEYVETENYELTPKGKKIAQYLFETKLSPKQQTIIKKTIGQYKELPFRELMKVVYSKAPEQLLTKSRIRKNLG